METFENTWRINTGSAILLTQLCIPHMQTQTWGRIIFNGSIAAAMGGVVGPHYASSKSAIHGLIHWLAPRYIKYGITVNAVAPGLIKSTKMFGPDSQKDAPVPPVGRFGEPEEVASTVELLATNAYMTNKIIVVDGGLTSFTF